MPVDPYELPCQELVELLTNYLENKLSPFDQTRFEKHLAICDPCVVYLNQFRQTIRAVGKLSEESIPPEAKRQLLDLFRDWKKPGGPVNALKFFLLAELVNNRFEIFPFTLYRAFEAAYFLL